MRPIYSGAWLLAFVLWAVGPVPAQMAPAAGPESGIESLPGNEASPGVAGFEGRYTVTGTNPTGGGSYQGVVTVRRTGETYRVIWRVAGRTFVGTGISFGGILSIAYNGGLAVYRPGAAGALEGQWAPTGSTRLGTENWRRKP